MLPRSQSCLVLFLSLTNPPPALAGNDSTMEYMSYKPGQPEKVHRFLSEVKAALSHSAVNAQGQLSMQTLTQLLPLSEQEDMLLQHNFPEPLKLKCNTDVCSFSAQGQATRASVQNGSASFNQPRLEFGPSISGYLVQLPGNGVELCHVKGIAVRKFFLRKRLQSIQLFDHADGAKMLLSLGDEPVSGCKAQAIQRLNRQNQESIDRAETAKSIAILRWPRFTAL